MQCCPKEHTLWTQKLNKSICHVIFQQHLPHAPLFWLQNPSSPKILIILQKKNQLVLYVIIMSRTSFRVNLLIWLNGSVFLYKLGGSGFESRWCHLKKLRLMFFF